MQYQILQDALADAGAIIGAPECHGLFCGILAIANTLPVGSIQSALFSEDADFDPANMVQLTDTLEALAEAVNADLGDPNFEFSMLLADDDTDISLRVAELKSWCQGFLYGLGVGGLSLSSVSESSEVSEVLADISKIAQVSDSAVVSSEDNERDFFELLEFVRMSALYIQEFYRGDAAEAGDSMPH